MHIAITAGLLADQLTWISRTLPARPAVPVLAGIRLEAGNDRVHLTATDYDIWSHATVEADTQGTPTTVVVPGRLLASLAGRLPAGHTVVLTLDADQVRLQCGPTRATVRTLPAEDYPTPPQPPATVGQVEASVLAAATTQVASAASTDHALPMLTGVHTVLGKGGIVLSATDRYRLAQQTVPWEPTLEHHQEEAERALLVPAATLTQAARAMTGTVTLGLDQDEVLSLSDGTRTLLTRLLDGSFPNANAFRDKVVQRAALEVGVDTTALADAVDRVALFAARNTPVRLEVIDHALVVRAGDDGDAGAEEVPADVAGEPGWRLSFNPELLCQTLAGARAEQVLLKVVHEHEMVLLVPDHDGDPGWQILMPIRQPATSTAVAA